MINSGERAARCKVGDQHGLFGIEQLCRLGHEVNAGEHDDVGIDLGGFAGEQQAVADDIGDAMKDLRRLVVVRQHHGVAPALQFEDGVDVVGEGRPTRTAGSPA